MVSSVGIHYTPPWSWRAVAAAKHCQIEPARRVRKNKDGSTTRIRWSAHAIIDRPGNAVQCVPTNKEASHAGDGILFGRSPNIGSFGVELVNAGWATSEGMPDIVDARHRNPLSKAERWQLFTDAQYEALASIIRELAAFPRAGPLLLWGHEDVVNNQVRGRPGAKLDPGPAFDWGLLLDMLRYECVQRVLWDFDKRAMIRIPNPLYGADGTRRDLRGGVS
jgi:N-acetyl-anhydromuramyl-L-alanine amidase AmpD